MPKRKTHQFTVTIETDADVSEATVHGYVKDACESWMGQLHPPFALGEDDDGDPMFNATVLSVKNAKRTEGLKASHRERKA